MKTTMSQGELSHLLSKRYAMKAFGMDSSADKQYIDGFNNALAAWPMFEECTSFASDAIDRATTQKEGAR